MAAKTLTAAFLLACAAPLAAGDAALWDAELLLRADAMEAGSPSAPYIRVRLLTGETPVQGWIDGTVPHTEDRAYDGEPVLAVKPADQPEDQRAALLWVREDVDLGQRDLVLIWMNLPAFEAGFTWLTRDASTPETPRFLLHSSGTQHVLWRRAEDGHLLYLIRSESGRERQVIDLTEEQLEGDPVEAGAYDIALVGGELLIAVAPDNGTGEVVVLGDGPPPNGGETLPVPIFQRSRSLESSGGTYQYDPSESTPRPVIHDIDGIPLITWTLFDDLLGVETLYYRYRLEGEDWSRWARMAIDASFTEADAVATIRDLLQREVTDADDPRSELPDDFSQHLDPGSRLGTPLR